MTKVVNIRKAPYDVYIGRAGRGEDGYFGNPFPLINEMERPYVLNQYKEYFLKRVLEDEEFRRRILELKDKTLGCFCHPKPCHGDVIADWLRWATSSPISISD